MKPDYDSPTALRAFLDDNGLGMRKRFGQNFLINPGARRDLIAALAPPPGGGAWEIGPGLGAMTRGLLDAGLSVRAFEIDPGFARVLRLIFAGDPGFTLVEGDALRTWRAAPPAPFLLGNLPYNVAATLLAGFVEGGLFFERIVVTVQREVAARMAAPVGSADYSSFSVLCASAYVVRPLMVLKGGSFYPRPNVDSQGVLMEPRPGRSTEELPRDFHPLVRGLFLSRRKKVRNNLAAFLSAKGTMAGADPAEAAAALLSAAGIGGDLRAENLSADEFAALAKTARDMGLLA